MILAVDVHYSHDLAIAGGVTFPDWTARREDAAYRSALRVTDAYIPGELYRRELPCILRLLEEHALVPDAIVVDGFVYLDGFRRPGLGKHLFDALAGRTPVIGVAKRRYAQAPDQVKVYRGQSKQPLYVTSVGIPLETAKALVGSMHGQYRIPSLLKRADRVARQTDEAKILLKI